MVLGGRDGDRGVRTDRDGGVAPVGGLRTCRAARHGPCWRRGGRVGAIDRIRRRSGGRLGPWMGSSIRRRPVVVDRRGPVGVVDAAGEVVARGAVGRRAPGIGSWTSPFPWPHATWTYLDLALSSPCSCSCSCSCCWRTSRTFACACDVSDVFDAFAPSGPSGPSGPSCPCGSCSGSGSRT